MAARAPELTIGRARIPGHPGERMHLRAALARALDHTDARPAGASPSEILLVREISLTAKRGAPAFTATEAGTVGTRIRSLRLRAARPAAGGIAGLADAVLFRDESEMVACLLLARGAGDDQRLWWRQAAARVVPELGGHGTAARVLATRGATVPAVIAVLDGWGAAERVLSGLTPGEIAVVARAIAAAWRLDVTAGSPMTAEAAAGPQRMASGPAVDSVAQAVADAGSPEAAALVAAARILVRSPASRRQPTGRRLLSRLLAEAGAGGLVHGAPSPVERMHTPNRRLSPPAERRPPEETSAMEISRPQATRNGGRGSPRNDNVAPVSQAFVSESIRPVASTKAQEIALRPQRAAGDGESGKTADRTLRDITTPITNQPNTGASAEEPAEPPDPTPSPPAAPAPQAASALADTGAGTVVTELGGVFFLWRLIEALELPETAADWRMGDCLDGWALLESIARVVVPVDQSEWLEDPVWAVLAALDGRDTGEPCGATMREPEIVRLPAAWRTPIPGPLHWRHDGARLVLWSAADGLLVRRRCRRDETAAVLGAELARLDFPPAGATKDPSGPPLAPVEATAGWRPTPALATWLTLFGPTLCARLSTALGMDTAAAVAQIRRPAEIHVTAGHVDVVCRAADATVPVRRAGLDLDPGWVPALGRVLSIHYV